MVDKTFVASNTNTANPATVIKCLLASITTLLATNNKSYAVYDVRSYSISHIMA